MSLVEVEEKLLDDWVSKGKNNPTGGEEYETPGEERGSEEEDKGGDEKEYENC